MKIPSTYNLIFIYYYWIGLENMSSTPRPALQPLAVILFTALGCGMGLESKENDGYAYAQSSIPVARIQVRSASIAMPMTSAIQGLYTVYGAGISN